MKIGWVPVKPLSWAIYIDIQGFSAIYIAGIPTPRAAADLILKEPGSRGCLRYFSAPLHQFAGSGIDIGEPARFAPFEGFTGEIAHAFQSQQLLAQRQPAPDAKLL